MRKLGLDDSIGFMLGIAHRKLSLLFMMRMKQYDITPEQWSVLYRIREQDGMIQKDIGDRAGKDKPTTTRILDTLEAKGYITKQLGKNDRRSFHVYITEQGIKAADEIALIEYQVVSDMSEVLAPDEYEHLAQLLIKISDHTTAWIEKEKEQ
ncbi:MarR family winged helix-turn-helix transcriptional regulator [Paenibacillus sp. NEAU-GSW1]|uniref:MarR family winged helix-turn-helix transcriptional regulator n=1 Tax=Paenibacillus sp. NEAU-GSW1 TaxID=2682486 RepID=UPI0012E1E813|nr:MarR family transcriptional regulator [Paenibacillus sp. NEAU-GSW1]MUT65400.1 MarR family transcriptional regulator [Paenibacillus sp. NEAU-GSW1]